MSLGIGSRPVSVLSTLLPGEDLKQASSLRLPKRMFKWNSPAFGKKGATLVEEAAGTRPRRVQESRFDPIPSSDASFDFRNILSCASKQGPDLTLSQILRPLGFLLYHAIDACVAARLHLAKEPVLRLTTENPPEMDDPACKHVGEIVAELLASKQADGLSRRYIETVRSHLVRFAAAFQTDINLITTAQIDGWLRTKKLGRELETIFVVRSLRCFISRVSTVFSPKDNRPRRTISPRQRTAAAKSVFFVRLNLRRSFVELHGAGEIVCCLGRIYGNALKRNSAP